MSEKSKGKIWRVRDDLSPCGSSASTELRVRGFDVTDFIFNPDEAYEVLSREKQEGLAVVDVSLVGKLEGKGRRYTQRNTDGFFLTGVRLMEDLVSANQDKFPQHAMIFTIADPVTDVYHRAKAFCGGLSIPLMDWRTLTSGYDFGAAVEKRYGEVFGEK